VTLKNKSVLGNFEKMKVKLSNFIKEHRKLIIIILLLPLVCFLYCLVTTEYSGDSAVKTDLSKIILNASIGLTSFLIAVVGILISIYWSPSITSTGRKELRPLIWWLISIICISTFASFAALSYNLYDAEFLFIWILISFSVALYIAIVAMINVAINLVVEG
jgi:hypothetical protein